MIQLARLVIRMGAGQKPVYDWFGFQTEQGVTIHGQELVDLPSAEFIDLLIPAAWLTSHRLNLPSVNKKQRDLLINQALEDRILGKLSDLEWVAAPAVDGVTVVWLIEKTRLALIKDWVAQSGIQFQRWLPEYCLLPSPFSYAHSSVGIMFCTEQECGCLDSEADLLALYPEQAFKFVAANELSLPKQTTVSFYQATKAKLTTHWHEWRTAVLLLIVCVFVYLLSLFMQWRSLSQQESALRQEIRQTFASIFPGVPVVDPILQWQSLQNAAGNQTSNASSDALLQLYKIAAQIDLDVGVDSVEVKAGKVTLVMAENQSAAVLAKLNAQGARVQSNKMPDGRISIEVQP